MSWSSASTTFDRIATSLIRHGASDACKQEICGILINLLQDGDWDGERDSLEQFQDDPAIVAAFADHGVDLGEEDDD